MVSQNQKRILDKMLSYPKGAIFNRIELSKSLNISIQSVSRFLNREKIKNYDYLYKGFRFSAHFELIESGNYIIFRRK